MVAEKIFFSSKRKGPKCGMRLWCDYVTSVAYRIPCSSRIPTQAAPNSPPWGCPQTISTEAVDRAPTNTKHGQWSIQEERELIEFLSNHKAEAGDGANFKQPIWTQAAANMSTLHPNVAFGTNQCLSKCGRVHQCLLSQQLTNCYSIA